MATLDCVSFERSIPDRARLAQWMNELDTPIDEHPAMIDAVDWLAYRLFMSEMESDPRVREEWERFLMSSGDDVGDDF